MLSALGRRSLLTLGIIDFRYTNRRPHRSLKSARNTNVISQIDHIHMSLQNHAISLTGIRNNIKYMFQKIGRLSFTLVLPSIYKSHFALRSIAKLNMKPAAIAIQHLISTFQSDGKCRGLPSQVNILIYIMYKITVYTWL